MPLTKNLLPQSLNRWQLPLPRNRRREPKSPIAAVIGAVLVGVALVDVARGAEAFLTRNTRRTLLPNQRISSRMRA